MAKRATGGRLTLAEWNERAKAGWGGIGTPRLRRGGGDVAYELTASQLSASRASAVAAEREWKRRGYRLDRVEGWVKVRGKGRAGAKARAAARPTGGKGK